MTQFVSNNMEGKKCAFRYKKILGSQPGPPAQPNKPSSPARPLPSTPTNLSPSRASLAQEWRSSLASLVGGSADSSPSRFLHSYILPEPCKGFSILTYYQNLVISFNQVGFEHRPHSWSCNRMGCGYYVKGGSGQERWS